MTPEPMVDEEEESGRFKLKFVPLDAARDLLSVRRTPIWLGLVGTDPNCLSALRTPRRLKDLSIVDWEGPIEGLSLRLPSVAELWLERCHIADGSLWKACSELRRLAISEGSVATFEGLARPSKLKAIQCLGADVDEARGVEVCDRLVSLFLGPKASNVFVRCPKGALQSITATGWPNAELPDLRDARALDDLNLERSPGVSLRELDHCVKLWYLRIGGATITETPQGDGLQMLEIVSAEKARAPDWNWLGRLRALRYVDMRTLDNVPWRALEGSERLQAVSISYEMLADREACRRFARLRPEVQILNGRHRRLLKLGEMRGGV